MLNAVCHQIFNMKTRLLFKHLLFSFVTLWHKAHLFSLKWEQIVHKQNIRVYRLFFWMGWGRWEFLILRCRFLIKLSLLNCPNDWTLFVRCYHYEFHFSLFQQYDCHTHFIWLFDQSIGNIIIYLKFEEKATNFHLHFRWSGSNKKINNNRHVDGFFLRTMRNFQHDNRKTWKSIDLDFGFVSWLNIKSMREISTVHDFV